VLARLRTRRRGAGVSAAVERARGKTLDGFEIVAAVPLAISDDAPAACRLPRRARTLSHLPFYRAMLEASGLGKELAAFDRNGEVAEGLTRAVGGVGKPEPARGLRARYREAGVTCPRSARSPSPTPVVPPHLEEASRW
jgi:hypothetical protein